MSVSGRLRARMGMLLIAGMCLFGAIPISTEGAQPRSPGEGFVRASYDEPAPAAVPGFTPGRLRATAAALVGLISVIVGGLAVARGGNRRSRGTVAMPMGLAGLLVSAMHLANSTAVGTGGGRAGAIVGLVLSLIGMSLGALALARARRAG